MKLVRFGWDNGIYWTHNIYDATTTNAGNDFTIPDETHFELIEKDLKEIGFNSIKFTIKESPHPDITGYHNSWLFINAKK